MQIILKLLLDSPEVMDEWWKQLTTAQKLAVMLATAKIQAQ